MKTPSQGRIRIWITADDGQHSAWDGYGSISFDLKSTREISARPTIQAERISAVTGRVISAEDGAPIEDAEVAPTQLGHHGTWADWDEAVKTDRDGAFRFNKKFIDGVAARHNGFGEQEIEFWQAQEIDCATGACEREPRHVLETASVINTSASCADGRQKHLRAHV